MTVAAKRDAPHVRFRETGYWLDKTVDQLLTEAVAKAPDKVAIVADRVDREQAPRLTYKELERLADRAASSLLRLGEEAGLLYLVVYLATGLLTGILRRALRAPSARVERRRVLGGSLLHALLDVAYQAKTMADDPDLAASPVAQDLAALPADRRAALSAVCKAINENLPTATACSVK